MLKQFFSGIQDKYKKMQDEKNKEYKPTIRSDIGLDAR